MDIQEKIWFLKELHKVIKKAYLRSFSTGVIVADYDALADEQKFAVGSPHVCAAVNCAKQVAAWASSENRYDSILYVFEKGTVHDKELNRLFNVDLDDKARAWYRIEKLALGDKREFAPLQAADVLAVETRKEIERILETENPRKVRESVKNLTIPALDECSTWMSFTLREFSRINS